MQPLAVHDAWSIFAPEAVARVSSLVWSLQAATYFQWGLAVVQEQARLDKELSDMASLDVDVHSLRTPTEVTRVHLVTLPVALAQDALARAHEGVVSLGGAGMDVLLARANRIWQVQNTVSRDGDPRAPVVVSAVLASVFLGPVLPPDTVTLYGIRGLRRRLDAMG